MPWFRPWQPVVVVVLGVLTLDRILARNRRKKAGLITERPGFSSEVDIVSGKLKERLEEMDRAVRFQRTLEPLSKDFTDFTNEVARTALIVDKKEILTIPEIQTLQQKDGSICTHLETAKQIGVPDYLERAEFKTEYEDYVSALTHAREKLVSYSTDLKKRGGIYKISNKELAIASILIVVLSATGTGLLWKFYAERTWPFWAGAGSLLFAGIILALLIGTLKDQES